MVTVFITGGAGQLGLELQALDWGSQAHVLAPDRLELDLTDRDAVDSFVSDHRPAVIVNAAAYTAVDRAEDEPAACFAANAFAPLHLARAAAKLGVPLVHVSTDYVFGPGEGVRAETDPPGPITVYGASKLAGEMAVLGAHDRSAIVRTAWVVSPFRANFVKTMLRLASERDVISVVDDQIGCPTTAADLALAVRDIALSMVRDQSAPTGVFHFVNAGEANWADLADHVMTCAAAEGLASARIERIGSDQYPTRARRPADSRLGTNRVRSEFGIVPRPWREAVAETVAAIAVASRSEKNL